MKLHLYFHFKLPVPINGRLKSLPGKTKRRFWVKFSPIFHRFSAYGTPSAVFPPTCLRITPISTYFRLFSAYFCLFFTYFLPIFCLWYPILIINSSMLPICRFSAHMFTDSAYFLLIFRLKFHPFSAGPVLPGSTY